MFFATPLIVYPYTSELFEFNKIIFIYLIATFILFFWLLKMIFLKKIILKKTPFDWAIFLFFLSQSLSTIFSIDPHTSFFGYYGRFNGGLLSIITYLILYYAAVSNLNQDSIERLLKISFVSAILTVLIGIPGKFNHDILCLTLTGQFNNTCWTDQFKPAERMFSTLGQPNWLGAFFSINFFIGVYIYLKRQNENNKWQSFLNFFSIILIFIGILFSRSRSAIVATVFDILIIIGYSFVFLNKFRFLKKKIIYLVLSVFLSVVIFKTGINQIDKLINIKVNVFHQSKGLVKQNQNQANQKSAPILVTESLDIRKIVWKGAIELGKRYPLLGAGVETFGYAYYFVRPKEHNLTSEWDYLYNRAHNEYLNYLATTGFFGLASYLLLIIAIIIIFIKKLLTINKFDKKFDINKDLGKGLLSFSLFLSFLSILITNFFGFSTTTISLFFYLIPAFLIISSLQTPEENQKKFNFKDEIEEIRGRQILLIFLNTLVSVFFILSIVRYWLADRYYNQAELYAQNNYYPKAIELINTALRLKYEHVYQDKLSTYLARLSVLLSYQKENQKMMEVIKLSKWYNDQSLKASLKNILYWRTKAKNHYLFYQATLDERELKKGIEALKYAIRLAPTDSKNPYNLAIFYTSLYESEELKKEKEKLEKLILDYLDQSIDLKPNYRDALIFKGQFLSRTGRKDEAKEIFKIILKKIDPLDQEAIEELKKI